MCYRITVDRLEEESAAAPSLTLRFPVATLLLPSLLQRGFPIEACSAYYYVPSIRSHSNISHLDAQAYYLEVIVLCLLYDYASSYLRYRRVGGGRLY